MPMLHPDLMSHSELKEEVKQLRADAQEIMRINNQLRDAMLSMRRIIEAAVK